MSEQEKEKMQNEPNGETQSVQETEQNPAPQRRRPLTDIERAQLKKRREIELRKRMQELREAPTAEAREEIYEELHFNRKTDMKPKTFKGKWDNYWYHYKFTTFAIAFVVILAAFFIHDMVTQTKYDVNLMMMSNANYYDSEDSLTAVKDKLSEYIEDYNEDGQKNVYLEVINVDREDPDNADPNTVMAQTTKMTVAMSEATTMVYLVDQGYYDYCKENGIEFVDLSQYSDNPNIDGDRYAIKNDSDFADLAGKDTLYLVIRDLDNVAKKDKQENIDRFNRDLEMVKKIIAE